MSDDADDEPAFLVQWTDHTDGRRYLSLTPQFTLAELSAGERATYIHLWDAFEPTPARPGALVLTEPFDQLVETGEIVTMAELVDRLREFTHEALVAARGLRSTVVETLGPAMSTLADACQPFADWQRETAAAFVEGGDE